MTLSTQEVFLGNAREIEQRVQAVCGRYFQQSDVVGVDYLSFFTSEQHQYDELCAAATTVGTKVAEKRGDVFRLNEEAAKDMLSRIVRVSEPSDTPLLGCADIIPVRFDTAQRALVEAGFEEKQKSLNGYDYTIFEVTDPALGVSLYVPSMRMTEVMGIDT